MTPIHPGIPAVFLSRALPTRMAVFCLTALGVGACGATQADPGESAGFEEAGTALENGIYNPVGPEPRPFVGRLFHNGVFFCTGSLVAADTFLTARHCTSWGSGYTFEVGGDVFSVAAFSNHPTVDLAVGTLDRPQATVVPACLDAVPAVLGEELTVSGCGLPTLGTCNYGFAALGAIELYSATSGTSVIMDQLSLKFGVTTMSPITTMATGNGDSGGPWSRRAARQSILGVHQRWEPLPPDGACTIPGAKFCDASVAVEPHVPWLTQQVARPVCVRGRDPLVQVRAATTLAGGVGARMAVLVNGQLLVNQRLRNTVIKTFSNHAPVPPGSTLDIIFSNHAVVGTEIRNLMVESVTVGGVTYYPTDLGVVFDRGGGTAALDGVNVQPGTSLLIHNGALRFRTRQ